MRCPPRSRAARPNAGGPWELARKAYLRAELACVLERFDLVRRNPKTLGGAARPIRGHFDNNGRPGRRRAAYIPFGRNIVPEQAALHPPDIGIGRYFEILRIWGMRLRCTIGGSRGLQVAVDHVIEQVFLYSSDSPRYSTLAFTRIFESKQSHHHEHLGMISASHDPSADRVNDSLY